MSTTEANAIHTIRKISPPTKIKCHLPGVRDVWTRGTKMREQTRRQKITEKNPPRNFPPCAFARTAFPVVIIVVSERLRQHKQECNELQLAGNNRD
jgi:hypothetical protein